MLRELLKQREEMLARANALVNGADAETRDMNEAERSEFEEIMGAGDQPGKLADLDARIEQIVGEREKLRQAAEKKFNATGASSRTEKPDGQESKKKTMAEYNAMLPAERLEFAKSGGQISG